jgi:hypothetical protein
MLPVKCFFIWPNGFRGVEVQKLTNQKKNCLWWPYLLTDRDEMSIFIDRIPSINTSYQDPVYLAKQFQRRSLQCEKLTDDGRQVIAKRG